MFKIEVHLHRYPNQWEEAVGRLSSEIAGVKAELSETETRVGALQARVGALQARVDAGTATDQDFTDLAEVKDRLAAIAPE